MLLYEVHAMNETEMNDEIVRLYRQGLSTRDIGLRLGVSKTKVLNGLRSQFEPRRPRHHAIAVPSKGLVEECETTFNLVRKLLDYDPETGALTWKSDRGPKARVGGRGGSVDKGIRWQICVCRKLYLAHRVIWLYMTGAWPKGDIDHINGDALDNRWANLRDVPTLLNVQNLRKARKNNRTGFLGVVPAGAKFLAHISVAGKKIRIGTFPTPEEAHSAYIEAKRRLHEGCTI